MVNDAKTDKPRGYAFIEYESEADMHGKIFNSFSQFIVLFLSTKKVNDSRKN